MTGTATRPARATLISFTVILTAISVPFWLVGFLPVPGIADGLPISALMFVVPVLAVWVLRRRAGAGPALVGQRIRTRQLTHAATCGLVVLALVVIASAGPDLLYSDVVGRHDLGAVAVLAIPLLVAAAVEELAWTGWLTPRLTPTLGIWGTGLVVGAIWAAWHVVPYAQAQNSLAWIVGQVVLTVVLRLLIVHLAIGDPASVLTAAAVHGAYNVAWQAVLAAGGDYSPWATSAVLAIALLAVVATRRRHAGRSLQWSRRSRRLNLK